MRNLDILECKGKRDSNMDHTPSAASMKRTTPSEILMLAVTSSEKFT